MKKELTIPVGTIYGIGLIATGICTSKVVDKALSKVDGNRIVNQIGRAGVQIMIRTVFAGLAAGAMSDDNLNIKIGGNKGKREATNKTREKKLVSERDMITRADLLWSKMFTDAIIISRSDSSYANISKEDVAEFNRIMIEFDEVYDFGFIPILTSDDENAVAIDILHSEKKIKNNFKYIRKHIV